MTDGAGFSQSDYCGYANFYGNDNPSVNVPLDSIPIVKVTLGTVNMPDDPAHDLAIAELAWRATPSTVAKAQIVRPWLGPDEPISYWANTPIVYYGWGHDDPGITGTGFCEASDFQYSNNLLFWNEKALDSNAPITQNYIDNSTPALNGFMFQARWTESEVAGLPLHGDSGGPLFIANPSGEVLVAGAASTGKCVHGPLDSGVQFLWARTMEGTNPAFISRAAINPADGTYFGDDVKYNDCANTVEDPDCDNVPSPGYGHVPADNCPNDYNPDQRDSDGDGTGDACDSCSAIYDDQGNINAEGENVFYSSDHAGGLSSIPPGASNDAILAHQNELNLFFPNDVCDVEPTAGPVPNQFVPMATEQDLPVGGSGLTGLPGREIAGCPSGSTNPACYSTSTALLQYSPFAYQGDASTTRQGWRRCVCAAQDANLCRSQCPYSPSQFDDPTSTFWIPLANGAGGSPIEVAHPLGPAPTNENLITPTLPPSYQTRWLWWTDPSITSLGAPPSVPSASLTENADVFGQRGRLWSFVAEYKGVRTSTLGLAALDNSVYSPFEIDEFGPPLPSFHIPRLGPQGNFLPCPGCPNFASLFFVDRGDPNNTRVNVFMSPTAQRVDITSQFTAQALAVLTLPSSRLIPAAEPGYLLTPNDVSAVMLSVDGNIPGTLTTNFRTGLVDVGLTGSDPPSLDQPPATAPVALGGRRRAVFAAATVHDGDASHHHHHDCRFRRHDDDNGNGEEDIWVNEAISPGWQAISIPRPMHGQVLGITVGGSTNSAYYVLDEIQERGAWMRLYEFTEMGNVTELVRWPADSRMTSATLSTSYDGALLVGTTSETQHEFLHFGLDVANNVTRVERSDGEGAIAIGPRAVRGGLGWGKASDRDGVTPMHTDSSEFVTPFRSCLNVAGEATRTYQPSTSIDFARSLNETVKFSAPATLSVVRGNAGEATATITFAHGTTSVACTYRGNSNPQSDQSVGLQYNLIGCDGGRVHGIEADRISVHAEGEAAAGSTTLRFNVNEDPDAQRGSSFGSLVSACR